MAGSDDLPRVLAGWMQRRRAQALITYYGPEGVRIELSGASAANAVAKAVGVFSDELLISPGGVVWLDMPPHWQTPLLVMGAWAAGLSVAIGSAPPSAQATVVAADRALDVHSPIGAALAVTLHPWGLPLGAATPVGWEDYAGLARSQPDVAALRWPDPAQPWLIAGADLNGADIVALSHQFTQLWGLSASGTLLCELAPRSAAGLLACTSVPALAGGGVVIADRADVALITRQERNEAVATSV